MAQTSLKTQVEQYRSLAAEHPNWTPKHFADYMNIPSREVTRLRMWTEASDEFMQLIYSGDVSRGAGEVILSDKAAQQLTEDDKLVLAHKIADGVIKSTGTHNMRDLVRELAELLYQLPLSLRIRWSSRADRLTFDQLRALHIDLAADRVAAGRAQREKEQSQITVHDGLLYPKKIVDWLNETDQRLTMIQEQMPVILQAAAAVRMKPERMARHLRELGDRLYETAEYLEEKSQAIVSTR